MLILAAMLTPGVTVSMASSATAISRARMLLGKIVMDKKVARVVCGGGHTGLVTVDGSLYMMGRGRDG